MLRRPAANCDGPPEWVVDGCCELFTQAAQCPACRAAPDLAVPALPRLTHSLICARRNLAGTWGTPGGAQRAGETAQEEAIRETGEEVGLDPFRACSR